MQHTRRPICKHPYKLWLTVRSRAALFSNNNNFKKNLKKTGQRIQKPWMEQVGTRKLLHSGTPSFTVLYRYYVLFIKSKLCRNLGSSTWSITRRPRTLSCIWYPSPTITPNHQHLATKHLNSSGIKRYVLSVKIWEAYLVHLTLTQSINHKQYKQQKHLGKNLSILISHFSV